MTAETVEQILEHLERGPATTCDLAEACGLRPSPANCWTVAKLLAPAIGDGRVVRVVDQFGDEVTPDGLHVMFRKAP